MTEQEDGEAPELVAPTVCCPQLHTATLSFNAAAALTHGAPQRCCGVASGLALPGIPMRRSILGWTRLGVGFGMGLDVDLGWVGVWGGFLFGFGFMFGFGFGLSSGSG